MERTVQRIRESDSQIVRRSDSQKIGRSESDLSDISDSSEKARRNLAYDICLDINEYKKIKESEGTMPPAEYAQKLLLWRQEKQVNLETNIGERFNAQLFEVIYPLKNGRMLNPFSLEPALETVVKGQQSRLVNKDLTHNQKRELAEVLNFAQTEDYFRKNPNANLKLINPSPPGGDYGSSFIDIYEQKESTISMKRYAVAQKDAAEHLEAAQKLTGKEILIANTREIDVELKKISIATDKSEEAILSIYLPDKEAISLAEYEKLKKAYRPWAANYIEAVMEQKEKVEIEQSFKAGLKFADIVMGKDTDNTKTLSYANIIDNEEIVNLVPILGIQSLREVKTGCGIQKGSYMGLIQPSLFAAENSGLSHEDNYGTREIHCEECGARYQRDYNKLEEKCRRCGGKKGIAC